MQVSPLFQVAKGGFTTLAGEIDHVARAGIAALRRQIAALTVRVVTLEETSKLCQLVQTAAQSIADGAVPSVLFDAEDLDPLGWHSTVVTTERVTPTIAGWYRVTFGAVWQVDTDYTRLLMDVQKNGASISAPSMRIDDLDPGETAGLGRSYLGSTPLIQVNGTTDWLSLLVHQTNTSAGALTVQCRLLVELVYPT